MFILHGKKNYKKNFEMDFQNNQRVNPFFKQLQE